MGHTVDIILGAFLLWLCQRIAERLPSWHLQAFGLYWRWRSRYRGGRPRLSQELRERILRMSLENPLWGAPQIHGQLRKLNFEVSERSVSRYMARRPGREPSLWRTFLHDHADMLVAIDLLTVQTLTFETLYAFIMIGHGRRVLMHTEVARYPTALWLANQITEVFPWENPNLILLRDNDRAYGKVFRRRLWSMGIRDKPIRPYSPWQNGCAERLIGSIRRECLDHVIITSAAHLRHVLKNYARYYNEDRTHLALGKDSPKSRPVEREGVIVSQPVLGGLHHRYRRKLLK